MSWVMMQNPRFHGSSLRGRWKKWVVDSFKLDWWIWKSIVFYSSQIRTTKKKNLSHPKLYCLITRVPFHAFFRILYWNLRKLVVTPTQSWGLIVRPDDFRSFSDRIPMKGSVLLIKGEWPSSSSSSSTTTGSFKYPSTPHNFQLKAPLW